LNQDTQNFNRAISSDTLAHHEDETPLESIDFDKIRQVITKSLPWIAASFIIGLLVAFLYLRYTHPIYNSGSILKLDIKSESGLLGIQNPLEQDIKGLSGEIEILKSRLFLSKVTEAVNLDISYYYPAPSRFFSNLVDERFGNSPFKVKYDFIKPSLVDKEIYLQIIDETTYELRIDENEPLRLLFGERIVNDNFIFTISKTKFFDDQKSYKDFFFIVNSKEAFTDYLENNVAVEPINFNANTVKISLSDPNPIKAKRLIDAIDTIYLNYTKEVKNLASQQKIQFLESQMEKTSMELHEYEDYFEKFTIENRTTDLSSDLSKTILMLNELDSQRFQIRNHLTSINALKKQLSENVQLSNANVPKSFQAPLKEYNELIKERELKLDNYNENTQVIARINHSLSIARETANQRFDEYEENLIKSRKEIKQKRAILESNFSELPSMGTSYNKNQRLYSLQEEFYFSLIKSKIELEIAMAGTVTNFFILSPASLPTTPVHPRKLIIYGMGVVFGLIISILIVALSYLLHDKITSQKDLEKRISIPILGLIPKYMQEKLDFTKLVVNENPKSPVSEALRAIRTNMEFMNTKEKVKVISVTSTVSGEGKTFIGVNLAAICAYSGQKVIVVDFDMRKPKVHMAFDVPKSNKGVSTILIGKHSIDECLEQSKVENLSFIQSGPTPPNPSELILSSNFLDFLEGLKERFDVIIIDTPPVGLVTDGILVMKNSDLPIYVVRSEYSRMSYIKSIQRLITNNRFNHMSVILNGVRYGSGYGYGYSYEAGYYEESEKERSAGNIFSKS